MEDLSHLHLDGFALDPTGQAFHVNYSTEDREGRFVCHFAIPVGTPTDEPSLESGFPHGREVQAIPWSGLPARVRSDGRAWLAEQHESALASGRRELAAFLGACLAALARTS